MADSGRRMGSDERRMGSDERCMGSDSSEDERWLPILPLSKSSMEVAASRCRRAELIPSGPELPKSISTTAFSHRGEGADTCPPSRGRACTPHTYEGCVSPGPDWRTTAPLCGEPGTSNQGGCSAGPEAVSRCSNMGCVTRGGPGCVQQQATAIRPCNGPIPSALCVSSISNPTLDTELKECHHHHADLPDLQPDRTCKEAETMTTRAELRDVGVQTETPEGRVAGWGFPVKDVVWDGHGGSLDPTELSRSIQNHLELQVAEATGSCEDDPDRRETPVATQAGSQQTGGRLKLFACCIRPSTMAD